MAQIEIPELKTLKFETHEWKHAVAILRNDFPSEWADIIEILSEFKLKKSLIVKEGGQKSLIANELDKGFESRGWKEKKFSTKVTVDEHEMDSPTHKVDCYKNRVALEIEWNNKDPFFDRDLNNFRLLFDLRAISIGVIITRSDELQTIFNSLCIPDGEKLKQIGKKYGNSTTHMAKLLPRLEGGGGGGCPVLVIGITKNQYVIDIEGYEKS